MFLSVFPPNIATWNVQYTSQSITVDWFGWKARLIWNFSLSFKKKGLDWSSLSFDSTMTRIILSQYHSPLSAIWNSTSFQIVINSKASFAELNINANSPSFDSTVQITRTIGCPGQLPHHLHMRKLDLDLQIILLCSLYNNVYRNNNFDLRIVVLK